MKLGDMRRLISLGVLIGLGIHILCWYGLEDYRYGGGFLPSWLLNLFAYRARHLEDIPDVMASATLWVGALAWALIGAGFAVVVARRLGLRVKRE